MRSSDCIISGDDCNYINLVYTIIYLALCGRRVLDILEDSNNSFWYCTRTSIDGDSGRPIIRDKTIKNKDEFKRQIFNNLVVKLNDTILKNNVSNKL